MPSSSIIFTILLNFPLEISFTQGFLSQVWSKLDQLIWSRIIFKFHQCISAILLERGVALHLIQLKYPSTKDALCQVLLKYWPSGSGEEDENVKRL